jgi:CheY-like chemotaxis protein
VSGVADARSILIVDDDRELRDVLLVLCELRGRQAVAVPTAEEALARMRGGLRPALIVFDLVMPGKGGWEFRAEQLADPKLADIPAVAISAAVRGDSIKKMLQVDAILPKPLDIDQLLVLIERYTPPAS